MTRVAALLAMGFGLLLAIAEVVRNWGDWQPWPFWIVDFIAAGALVWGGFRTLNRGSSRLLSAAWGFTVGIFWMSFFSHTEAMSRGEAQTYASGAMNEGTLTFIIGAMLVVAIAGLIMSLMRRTI